MTWEDIPGWYTYLEMHLQLVKHVTHGRVVEAGCFLGRGVCSLADIVKQSGKPIRITAVDTGTGSGVENGTDNHAQAVAEGCGTFAGALHRNIVRCGHADAVDVLLAPSVKAADYFPDRSLAAVVIDAGHDYASVAADITAWLPKVAPGGVLCGDDYGVPGHPPVWPGVRRAVEELLPGFRCVPHEGWWYEVK